MELESRTDILEYPEDWRFYPGKTRYYIGGIEVSRQEMETAIREVLDGEGTERDAIK